MANDKKRNTAHLMKEYPVTYDDYAKMPDDGICYEINNGRLEAMTPSPNALHQFTVQQIEHCMIQKCSPDYAVLSAPIDVILSETEVRQPDLVMIKKERLSIITKRGIEGPPDLVVEALSPTSAKRDRQTIRLCQILNSGILDCRY